MLYPSQVVLYTAQTVRLDCPNPQGCVFRGCEHLTQANRFAPALGWRPQSLWDCLEEYHVLLRVWIPFILKFAHMGIKGVDKTNLKDSNMDCFLYVFSARPN